MKKNVAIAVIILLVAALGAVIWQSIKLGEKAEKPEISLEEAVKKLTEEKLAGQEQPPLENIDPKKSARDTRVYFCKRAIDRILAKGLDLQSREVRSAATLINREKLRQYYTCKAVKETDSSWCGKLKALPLDKEENQTPYAECMVQYQAMTVAYYYRKLGSNRSVDELEKILDAKNSALKDEIMAMAEAAFSKDPGDCDKFENMQEKMPCLLLKPGQDPPAPPATQPEALNFYYTFMAYKHNDPSYLERTKDFDKFVLLGTFTDEAYCDAAFRQAAGMFCTAEK